MSIPALLGQTEQQILPYLFRFAVIKNATTPTKITPNIFNSLKQNRKNLWQLNAEIIVKHIKMGA